MAFLLSRLFVKGKPKFDPESKENKRGWEKKDGKREKRVEDREQYD